MIEQRINALIRIVETLQNKIIGLESELKNTKNIEKRLIALEELIAKEHSYETLKMRMKYQTEYMQRIRKLKRERK